MALERTFAIIKPDAVAKGQSGEILKMIERRGIPRDRHENAASYEAGRRSVLRGAQRRGRSLRTGRVHDGRASGACWSLESENAIAKWRDLMGATNPANAAEGTIRKRFAENIERNCVHGSDASETAAVEIPFSSPGTNYLKQGSGFRPLAFTHSFRLLRFECGTSMALASAFFVFSAKLRSRACFGRLRRRSTLRLARNSRMRTAVSDQPCCRAISCTL